jgi:hypothetical protein
MITSSLRFNKNMSKKKNQDVQNRVIKERLVVFKSGPEGQRRLLADLKSTPAVLLAKKIDEERLRKINQARCVKNLDRGQIGKAANSLLSGGIAEIDAMTVKKIKEKFPVGVPPISVIDPPVALQIEEKDVVYGIKSFQRGSSGGRDGCKPQFLQDILRYTNDSDKERFISTLTKTMNRLLDGKFPAALAPFFASASLVPLIKPNKDLRPIAIGLVLRRLVCKLAVRKIMPALIRHLSPTQLGVGVSGGCESIVHAIVKLAEEQIDDPTMASAAMDSWNAFNVTKRQAFHDEVLKYIPGIYRLVILLYGCIAIMFLGCFQVESSEGVTQGCPLGPPLYAMAARPVTLLIKEACPDLKLSAYYLDDGTLNGKAEDIARALDVVMEVGPKYGMYLNASKTVALVSPKMTTEERERIFGSRCQVTDQGIKLLGGAVGTSEFARGVVDSTIKKSLKLLEEILQMQDNHRQFILIKYCLSGYKLSHMMKVLPPSLHLDKLQEFDEALNDALAVTLGSPLSSQDRLLIELPSKLGGLGLPSATSLSGATYLASRAQSGKLVEEMLGLGPDGLKDEILVLLREFAKEARFPEECDLEALLEGPNTQKNLLKVVNEVKADALLLTLGPRQKELFEASRSVEHVSWLEVLPSSPLKQHLPNDVFKTAVGFQLGLKLRIPDKAKCEVCSEKMDPYGVHGTLCKWGGGSIARHDRVRDVLADLCRQSGYTTRIEEKELLPDSERRPADVFVLNWSLGKSLCIDVAVICGRDKKGIENKEKDKRRLNLVDCENVGLGFAPFVLDSYGRMGLAAHRLLNKLSFAYAETLEIEVSVAKGRLRGILMQQMIVEQSREIVARVWKL